MVKTYYKVVRRMFKKQFTRLLSLIGIILISVGFVSGIGSPTDMIKDSIENYYKKQNVNDFIIKSKTGRFTQEEIDKIKNHFGQENVETGMSFDIKTGEKKSLRLYFLDFDKWNINVPELVEGEKINKDDKNLVYAEAKDNKINGYNIGEKIEISLKDALNLPFEYKINVTVKGIVLLRLEKMENLVIIIQKTQKHLKISRKLINLICWKILYIVQKKYAHLCQLVIYT